MRVDPGGPSGREEPDVLLGEYEQRLDEKNRMTIPARLREHFADGVFLTRSLDQCIEAYDREGWEGYVARNAERLDAYTREGRRMERYLFGAASRLEMDRQGRIALPSALVKHAELDRDVIVAGVRDRLEIWDRDAWHRENANFEGSAGDVAERLAHEAR